MATTPDVSFTSREIAVMAEVLARIAVPSFTASDWKDIAAKAGITDGDVARNAKYSFAQAKKKFGVKEGQNGKKSKDSMRPSFTRSTEADWCRFGGGRCLHLKEEARPRS